MQPTLAAFNFKSLSNDQDGPSTLEENIEACRFPTSMDPQKIEVLPSSWLSQFDLLGEKRKGAFYFSFLTNY